MNTLFSYFKKKEPVDKAAGDSKNVLSPSRNCQNNVGKHGDGEQGTKSPAQKKGGQITGENAQDFQYAPGDLVWAKLEGYPWWPSLVCNHPTQNSHIRKIIKPGKKVCVHVQFFDDPPSRSWINIKYVKPFNGSDAPECHRGGQFFSTDRICRTGMKEADQAMKMSRDDRLQLVVELLPSSEEEEEESGQEEQAEKMEWDADIFDNEMSDSESKDDKAESKESDESKENIEDPNEKKKKDKHDEKEEKRPSRRIKRRKIVEVDSGPEDSEDEFKPGKDDASSDSSGSSGVDENDVSDIESESDADSPVKKSGKRKRSEKVDVTPVRVRGPSMSLNRSAQKKQVALAGFLSPSTQSKSPAPSGEAFTPTVSDKTKSKLSTWSAPAGVSSPAPVSQSGGTIYFHQKQEFLEPDKIRDIEKRKINEPDYDPRTLHIPENFKRNLTPAMKQWWDMKEKHFDTVLFFKMGKFYELYHMDADIGVKELGLIYMKGDVAHSGFPEIAFGRYSDTLIQKGYKVARVEQTETPEMMNDRLKNTFKPVKFDKVVKREICRITTKATKTYSFIDGDSSNPENSYLLALAEKDHGDSAGGGNTYGVCFVDTSIGKFYIGQFEDDRHLSCLRTLFAHYTPAQILYERCKLSTKSSLLMKNNLPTAIKDALRSSSEFWDCEKTLKYLAESGFFCKEGDENIVWPEELKQMLAEGDSLCMTPAEGSELAISALGALTWYLKESCLDEELLSLGCFEIYKPPSVTEKSMNQRKQKYSHFASTRQRMVLDGVTLANLDVLRNSSTLNLEGSLLEKCDHCVTPFGKRLFQQWLCVPLCNPNAINDRLDALEDLKDLADIVSEATCLMKKIPDLERLISKIHTLGSASRSKNHPDSRAIFYEDVVYSKRKIEDFLSALEGFKLSSQIMKSFKTVAKEFRSKLLKQTVQIRENGGEGRFPDLLEKLSILEHAFDHKEARSKGVIIPNKGVHPEYDLAMLDIKRIKRELDDYLEKQRTRLANRSIVYWGTGKNRFQLEVPECALKRVPDEYEVTSQKKGHKRYKTKDIERMLNDMIEAEERRDSALKDTMRKIFSIFDESYGEWEAAVQCLAVLDVLISMMQYSHCSEGNMCRPEFILPSEDSRPFLEIREGRHPCLSSVFSGDDFIPNDTLICVRDEADTEGGDAIDENSSIVLVTGPNMGGKSTLMRQVGLIVIMAQMGLYVPADKCRLTPVDRVFTRLGASDRIMAGESTFFVELSETSCILKQATEHSLVLFDELGRGTATYDGTAIACSVVQHLSENVKCRTLFSTHYHTLVEEFSHDPNIRLGHMACMVENDNEEDLSQETITFLYKFVRGACPKSYGFNAARLALIPESVIRSGQMMSRQLESSVEKMKLFRKIYHAKTRSEVLNSV